MRPVPAQPPGGLRAHPAHRQRHLRRRLQGRCGIAVWVAEGCRRRPGVGSVATQPGRFPLQNLRGASVATRPPPPPPFPALRGLPPSRAARSSPVPPFSGVCPVAPAPVLVGAGGRPAWPPPAPPRRGPAPRASPYRRPGRLPRLAGPCEGATPGGRLWCLGAAAFSRLPAAVEPAGSRFLPLLGAGSGVCFTGGA